ncbi:MAG: hypothetical protein WB787_07190 [Candidatus Acidiferrales bacterium]
MTMPIFGIVDVVVAGLIAFVAVILLIVEIPDMVRYMKIKSM